MARLLWCSHIATVLPARPLTGHDPPVPSRAFFKNKAGQLNHHQCWRCSKGATLTSPTNTSAGATLLLSPSSTYPWSLHSLWLRPWLGMFFLAKRVSGMSSGGHEFRSHQPPRDVLTVPGDRSLWIFMSTQRFTRGTPCPCQSSVRFSSQRAA